MTLAHQIKARIRANGPMTVVDFMSECLLHPTLGYYTSHGPFGAAGDFITAPEISQMFGELIGLSIAQAWIDQGRPGPFSLVELGPGRGTLMADMLRATKQVPGFTEAARVILIEASPRLQTAQRETLGERTFEFLPTVDDLPPRPTYFVANEFFDALPIRQFVRVGRGWAERHIGLEGETLAFGLSPPAPNGVLSHRLSDTADGDVVEVASTAGQLFEVLTGRIRDFGGVGLCIDYGDWRSLGDTLQAVKDHNPVPVLDTPGLSDLTAHVDFENLAAHSACNFGKLAPQGVFLERLGITARARALSQTLSGNALDMHIAAHRRLTHPDEMGNLFKVFGVFQNGRPPPPGLEL